MLFSQKIGKTPIKKDIQLESIDSDLQNGLWNVYRLLFLEEIGHEHKRTQDSTTSEFYCYRLWHDFFKKRIEDIPYHYTDAIKSIREFFF